LQPNASLVLPNQFIINPRLFQTAKQWVDIKLDSDGTIVDASKIGLDSRGNGYLTFFIQTLSK
jgi:hypothetical protein